MVLVIAVAVAVVASTAVGGFLVVSLLFSLGRGFFRSILPIIVGDHDLSVGLDLGLEVGPLGCGAAALGGLGLAGPPLGVLLVLVPADVDVLVAAPPPAEDAVRVEPRVSAAGLVVGVPVRAVDHVDA